MTQRSLALACLLALGALGATAQHPDRFEEIREFTLPADRAVIAVDGGHNGGASVQGWDRDEILVRAKIQISRSRVADPAALAQEIGIELADTIHAIGPRRGDYSVSFEIFAPHHSNFELNAQNGGVHVSDVTGAMNLRTLNGGLHLARVGGDVTGRATNGGLHVELGGDHWEGDKLDVVTTNGGVRLYVPEDYSAELETGTVNGGIDIDFPVTISGRFSKHFTTTLGDGGAPVRVRTTNGGVRIRRT